MFRDNSIKGVQTYFSEKLKDHFDTRTIRTFFQWTCEDLFDLTSHDLLLDQHRFGESELLQFRSVANDLRAGIPIQYVLKSAHFYGRKFHVAPGVLIPRPETELLIELAKKLSGVERVLDVGCGSGIISVTLKLEHPGWQVSACDISEDALRITSLNAEALKADVAVFSFDILKDELDEQYDLICSNPPYVLESDKDEMAQHVLDHEPGLALFVPNDDPQLFYRKLAELGRHALSESGKLMVEIHEKYGKEVKELFTSFGYRDVVIHDDLQDKNRVVTANK